MIVGLSDVAHLSLVIFADASAKVKRLSNAIMRFVLPALHLWKLSISYESVCNQHEFMLMQVII